MYQFKYNKVDFTDDQHNSLINSTGGWIDQIYFRSNWPLPNQENNGPVQIQEGQLYSLINSTGWWIDQILLNDQYSQIKISWGKHVQTKTVNFSDDQQTKVG